jgi:hypothetical protein
VPCPTCGAETQPDQRFCMDCGHPLDEAASAPTRLLPSVDAPPRAAPTAVVPVADPTDSGPTAPEVAAGAPAALPITIVEQTIPIRRSSYAPENAPEAHDAEVAGMVWHPLAVDPWPTPQSRPIVVGSPVRAVPVAVVGLLAAILGVAGTRATVGSYQFADGTAARFTLDELRSNSSGVMVAVTAVLVVGVALAFARQRIGIGLAGGAALALTSIATMDVALVVAQLHNARAAGVVTGSVTITWEPAFFAIVGAAALGLVAGVLAFGAWREGGARVHPVIAALGAAGVATMIVGALVPIAGRTWGDNLGIAGFSELPSALRLAALGVVGAAGLVGFLARRRWTMGLAAGATAALAAQWIGALAPPVPNTRGGPGVAITPLEGSAQAIHAGGLLAVVVLALAGWLLAERYG